MEVGLVKKRLSSQAVETMVQSEKTLEAGNNRPIQRPSMKKLL